MPGADVTKSTEAAPGAPDLPALALALFLLTGGTTVILTSGGPSGAVYMLRWSVVFSDIFLGLVVLTQVPHLPALWRDRRRHRCAVAAVALAVSLVPSLALHPSGRGGVALFRWIGVAMIALAVGRLARSGRDLVVAVFAGATVVQVVIAVAQRAADGPIGLNFLGEPDALEIGGRYASSALMVHPYVFAAWCALAAAVALAAVARAKGGPLALRVAAVVPFLGVGLTMSRAGVLALVLVVMAFGVAAVRLPPLRLVLVAAVAVTALGIVFDASGWATRAAQSTSGSASGVTSNRGELMRQASGLLRDSPISGVGPGRYVEALVKRPDLVELSTQPGSRPVHLVPYLVLVEGGLLMVPALLFLAWAALTQTWQARMLGAGVTLAVLPFMLLDHLNWSYPQGLVLTGLWLGALDHLATPADG